MFRIAPVHDSGAEVHDFLHAAGNLQDERVVLALAAVERLVEVLPEQPRHSVRAAEAVSRHAEVVDEPSNAMARHSRPVSSPVDRMNGSCGYVLPDALPYLNSSNLLEMKSECQNALQPASQS